jgi:hypothetical protein
MEEKSNNEDENANFIEKSNLIINDEINEKGGALIEKKVINNCEND